MQTRTDVKTPNQNTIQLRGGPYDLEQCAHTRTQSTLVFTAKGQTGFYDRDGQWVPEKVVPAPRSTGKQSTLNYRLLQSS